MTKKKLWVLALLGLLVVPIAGQYRGGRAGDGNGQNLRKKHQERNNYDGGMAGYLLALPDEELGPDEIAGLIRLREEEKLARDVYSTLADLWKNKIFVNIAQSEQRHMDAVKVLLEKYGLDDPVGDDTTGLFSDPELQVLYSTLVEQGQLSLTEGLRAGCLIEDLDIFDLKRFLVLADNSDVKTLYQNLMKGSRNHLRSFVSLLGNYGDSYQATYLTQEEIESILESPMERGLYDEEGNPLFGNTGW